MPEQPKKPVEPSKRIDPGEYESGGKRGFSGIILVATIIGFCVAISNERYDIIIWIILIFLCALFMYKTATWDKESHEKKRSTFKKDLSEYPLKLARYKKELSSYEKVLDEYNV